LYQKVNRMDYWKNFLESYSASSSSNDEADPEVIKKKILISQVVTDSGIGVRSSINFVVK